MSQANRIIKNMAWMSLGELATKGMSFVTNAYLARILTLDGFGQLNFALATVAYFTVFVTLGFNVIGAREIARNHKEAEFYVNTIISIRLFISLISFVLLAALLFMMQLPWQQTYLIIIASANILVAALLIDWYYQGIERMEILGFRQFLIAAINLTGILFLVRQPNDVINAMYVMTASTVFNSLWILILYIRNNGKIKLSIDIAYWKKLIREAIPISLSQIFLIFLANTSIILLGLIIDNSSEQVALYTSANKIVLLIFLPIIVVQVAFYPHFSRSETRESRINAYNKYIILNFVVGSFLAALVFFFSKFVIGLIYGQSYTEAAPLLSFMMLLVIMSYFSQTAMHPLIAWKKEKAVLKIVGLAAFLNLILNYFLIDKYEMYGAAAANIISEAILLILLLSMIVKIIRYYPYMTIIKIIVIAVVCAYAGYFVSSLINSDIVGILTAIISYIFVIFGVKIVTITEIKGYLKK